MNLFGNRRVMSNIAQILIVLIIFPFVAIIFSIFFGNSAVQSFLFSLFAAIPVFECTMDLISYFHPNQIIISGITSISSNFGMAILQSLIMSMVLEVFKTMYDIITFRSSKKDREKKAWPILATFLAVLFCNIIFAFFAKASSLTVFLSYALFVIILAVGIRLMFSALTPGKYSFKRTMRETFWGAVTAGCISGYATSCGLLLVKGFADLKVGIICILGYTVATMISGSIWYFIRPKEERKHWYS